VVAQELSISDPRGTDVDIDTREAMDRFMTSPFHLNPPSPHLMLNLPEAFLVEGEGVHLPTEAMEASRVRGERVFNTIRALEEQRHQRLDGLISLVLVGSDFPQRPLNWWMTGMPRCQCSSKSRKYKLVFRCFCWFVCYREVYIRAACAPLGYEDVFAGVWFCFLRRLHC
jgi:hypothetical protein